MVNDTNHYKAVPSQRDYVASSFNQFSLHVNEIGQSGFESICSANWLTGFIVSVLLNLLNSEDAFQISN